VSSSPDAAGGSTAGRRDNGLEAASFVPLAEVDAAIGALLLDALGRARIAAYLEPTADPVRELLYAAAGDRGDARTIITAVSRANDSSDRPAAGAQPGTVDTRPSVSMPDALAGRDTEAEFSALIADWHVDTIAAIRSAERDLTREDAEWRARLIPPPADASQEGEEEEHFVPPPPPPLPRLSAATIWALLLVAASFFVLIAGGWLGFGSDFTFLVGIGGILVGAGVFVMKLRAHPEDDDDDGAIL
jgi:hypothetical protein